MEQLSIFDMEKVEISKDNMENPALLRDIPFDKVYEAARKDFFDCAERANLDKVAERWTTDMYRAEPGTSERTDL